MDREDEIRKIAFQIWEEENRPQGREKIHWAMAEARWKKRQKPKGGSKKPRPRAPKGGKRVLGRTLTAS
jgi:hypothetical protein